MSRTASRTGMASPAGTSPAATAATTPSARRAWVRSTRLKCPWAMGERTTRAHTWPAALKSSPNRPRPRSSRGSSLRGIRVPITLMGRPPPRLARGQHGLDDPLVAGAPAQVRRHELAHLRLGEAVGGGPFGQVGLGEHEEAGGAEPALQRVMVAERLLEVGQLIAGGQALDGADLGAVGLHAEDQAGPHRAAVDQHRAGAADPVLAAQVSAGVAQVVAQHVGQRPAGLHGELVLTPVDAQPDLVHVLHAAPTPARASAALTSSGSTG